MALVLHSKYWEIQCSDSLSESLDVPYSKSGRSWSFFFLPLFTDFASMYHIPVRGALHQRKNTSTSSEVLYASFLVQNVLNCNNLSSSAFSGSVT